MKKCKHCNAPLEGFFYKTIGKLMGLKESVDHPGVCNKCEDKEHEAMKQSQQTQQHSEQATERPKMDPKK